MASERPLSARKCWATCTACPVEIVPGRSAAVGSPATASTPTITVISSRATDLGKGERELNCRQVRLGVMAQNRPCPYPRRSGCASP
eukprot:9952907-Alexandrium_andersonii.AAC.1